VKNYLKKKKLNTNAQVNTNVATSENREINYKNKHIRLFKKIFLTVLVRPLQNKRLREI